MSGKQSRPMPAVLTLGGMRYTDPLDPTQRKKFRLLSNLGAYHVIAFSADSRWRRFKAEGSSFHLVPSTLPRTLRYLCFFLSAMWWGPQIVRRHGVDVVMAQSPYEGYVALWVLWGIRLLNGRRLPLVVETHGDWEGSLPLYRGRELPRLATRLRHWLAKSALERASVVRTISNYTSDLVRARFPHKPIVSVPAYTDLDVFREAGQASGSPPSAMGLEKPYFLFAGTLVYLKGAQDLIEAVAGITEHHPDLNIAIAGAGPYENELRQLTARLHLEDRVRFLGNLAQKDLAQVMRFSEAVVIPSRSEGLGRVALEAMACGKSVIAARVGGLTELIQDGVTGLTFETGNVPRLGDCLQRILEHPELGETLGRAAADRVGQVYSTDIYLRALDRIFARARDCSSFH